MGVTQADTASWSLPLFLTLLAFSVVSDIRAVETAASIKISGSFLALVLAMVFIGGPPAALIGVVTILFGWLRWRDSAADFLINLVTYAWFPLLGGLLFHWTSDALSLTPADGSFYLIVFGVFVVALAINFAFIAGYSCYLEGSSMLMQVRKVLNPGLAAELFAALLAMGVAYLYQRVGLAAIALFGIVLFTFQYMLGQLLLSEQRAETLQTRTHQLHARTKQLATLQVGVLSALMHTLDLRDRMTARHSAAVARYVREIAMASGSSKEEQDLVHTAGLLHDIGKFIFPDAILKGDAPLTEKDWKTIRMHPYQGAKIVSDVDGYGPVGEIILAHHERIDGRGYPRGLGGDAIPSLSRMISVADTYDVMTARDSYREPMSSFEAIQELKRVSGRQLDADYVEVFIQVLAGKDVRYRHGEDADFDAELGVQKRIDDYSFPQPVEELEGVIADSDGLEPEVKVTAAHDDGRRRSFASRLIGRREKSGVS